MFMVYPDIDNMSGTVLNINNNENIITWTDRPSCCFPLNKTWTEVERLSLFTFIEFLKRSAVRKCSI